MSSQSSTPPKFLTCLRHLKERSPTRAAMLLRVAKQQCQAALGRVPPREASSRTAGGARKKNKTTKRKRSSSRSPKNKSNKKSNKKSSSRSPNNKSKRKSSKRSSSRSPSHKRRNTRKGVRPAGIPERTPWTRRQRFSSSSSSSSSSPVRRRIIKINSSPPARRGIKMRLSSPIRPMGRAMTYDGREVDVDVRLPHHSLQRYREFGRRF